jgi:hypothetical protein
MCKTPVTFGGGITIEYGSLPSGVEEKYFLFIQWEYHLDSEIFGLYVLGILID